MATKERKRVEFARFTDAEEKTVDAIVKRAVGMFAQFGVRRVPMGIKMDISAVHARTPLRLDELLNADDLNFSHDIGGIAKYLDRDTGELTDCFVPRFT